MSLARVYVTTELLVSYLIILQMNFALTMTSDRLMGSVDPSFSWGMRKGLGLRALPPPSPPSLLF